MKAIAVTFPIARADTGARAIGWTIAIGLPLAAIAWIAAGEPSGPACLMRELTHVDCPTCGMTRALALLVRGEWRASLAVHPWTAALVVQLFVGWMAWIRWLLRGGGNPERWIPWFVLANGSGLIVLWVVRLAAGSLPR